MHEWAYSGENVVNLCATSRTTTMGELRIAVGEMRNEYHISSALLPAISTLDSCYLLLHLQVLFAAAVVVVLVGLLIVVLLSLQDTPVDGCPTRTVAIEHKRKCRHLVSLLSLFPSLSLSFTLTADKLIGSRCGRNVLNFILSCRKTTSCSINNIIFVG